MIGLGLSIPQIAVRQRTGMDLDAAIRALFKNGEQGAWYDPSDLSTLFQDSAGAVPGAVGQPVGLMLDKSPNGNHASQVTTIARPILRGDTPTEYGPELLQQPLDFGSDYWLTTATTVLSPTSFSTTGAAGFRAGRPPLEIGKTYEVIAINPVSSGPNFDIVNASYGEVPRVLRLNTGTRAVFTATNSAFYIRAAGAGTFSLDGISVREVKKFKYYYTEYDGIDDFLSTQNIDLTGYDTAHMFVGIVSNENRDGGLLGHGPGSQAAGTYNSFELLKLTPGGNRVQFRNETTSVLAANPNTPSAGVKRVLHGAVNKSTSPRLIFEVNGQQTGASNGNLGPGNLENFPLYIGARGGLSIFSNVNIYAKLVVAGPLTEDQIALCTRWVNSKMGAY